MYDVINILNKKDSFPLFAEIYFIEGNKQNKISIGTGAKDEFSKEILHNVNQGIRKREISQKYSLNIKPTFLKSLNIYPLKEEVKQINNRDMSYTNEGNSIVANNFLLNDSLIKLFLIKNSYFMDLKNNDEFYTKIHIILEEKDIIEYILDNDKYGFINNESYSKYKKNKYIYVVKQAKTKNLICGDYKWE